MSSFVWMKVLESTPERYDRGIRLLSGGRIDDVYGRIAGRVASPGRRILDVGCGTGGLTLACAARGARVTGIDVNAGMLEVARGKPVPAGGSVEWLQLGAAEIEDRFPERSLDAVVSCLAMSELSKDEQDYFLRIALTRLVPSGELMLADEVAPRRPLARALYRLGRLPLLVVSYLLTQATTRPVEGLVARVRAANFTGVEEEHPWASFLLLHAVKGAGP